MATTAAAAAAAAPQLRHLVRIGPDLWNVRSSFKVLGGWVDISTHMSLIRLNNGKFLAIDTIPITDEVKRELDQLTNNGLAIEAVVATHPFHTSYFTPFYSMYPTAKYYGTPRHLKVLPEIPWTGSIDPLNNLKKWEPEVQMRIPAGTEFELPTEDNHFSNVFVYHPKSKTVHNDDTVLYTSHPSLGLRLLGHREGQMTFHKSLTKQGLKHTEEAPFQFRDWVTGIIQDWDFDNLLTAHNANKLGGAKQQLYDTLRKTEPKLEKLAKHNSKYDPLIETVAPVYMYLVAFVVFLFGLTVYTGK